MPRRLKIRLDDLMEAFDSASPDYQYLLDLETGEIVLITSDTRKNLDDVYDHLIDFGEEGFWAVENVLRERGYNEQEQRSIFAAFLIEGGWGLRYLTVPVHGSNTVQRDMKEFAGAVQNAECAAAITRAIGSRSPFRDFRDALAPWPEERERWAGYRDSRTRARVLEWLGGEGIEPLPAE